MNALRSVRNLSLIFLVPFAMMAQTSNVDQVPLKNWSAPAYWQPLQPADRQEARLSQEALLNPLVSLPTQPLVFVAMTPCRVIDTRSGAGFPSPFGPPSLLALAIKTYAIQSSTGCSIPSTALAYSFNITVTPITTPGVNPPGYLGFLTVYPFSTTNNTPPNASTLNNYLGTVVSNAAIIPAGDSNGSVNFYPHDATDLIVDINGYYIQGAVGSSQWTTTGSNIFYNLGNVGVGTSTPSQKLDVAGFGRFSSGIVFGDGSIQTTAASGGGGSSQWTTNASGIFYNGGNVGIGTSTPGAKLEVNGNLTVDNNINLSGNIYSGNTGVAILQAPIGPNGTVGVGYGAVAGNVSGFANIGVGTNALHALSSGSANTAVGQSSLLANTSGGTNTALGEIALASNTTGSDNTAVGAEVFPNNISGNNNTAIGAWSLTTAKTASNNTTLGAFSLYNATAGNNIGIGYNAGMNVSSGANNIEVGNTGISSDDSVIRIGTLGTHTSTFVAGISGVNVSGVPVLVSSSGQLGVASSSRRFKKDIEDMGDSTSNLMRLRPVTYRYKQPFEDGSQPLQYGLIAEEVEQVYPELVAHSADGKIETVRYQMLDSMLLNEVQRLSAKDKSQQEKIQSLEERLSRMESALEKLTDGSPR